MVQPGTEALLLAFLAGDEAGAKRLQAQGAELPCRAYPSQTQAEANRFWSAVRSGLDPMVNREAAAQAISFGYRKVLEWLLNRMPTLLQMAAEEDKSTLLHEAAVFGNAEIAT